MIFPFLFITIACGAVSGFHCLVSSGTSSKQIRAADDARFVGYGSMLTEGFGDFGHPCLWGWPRLGRHRGGENGRWRSGLGGLRFLGSCQRPGSERSVPLWTVRPTFLSRSVCPQGWRLPDGSACRVLCRHDFGYRLPFAKCVIQEIGRTLSPRNEGLLAFLRNKHGATIFAVLLAGAMAAAPPTGQEWSIENAGKGGLLLWPLFGATNQLLAGLSFLVITFYLWRRNKPVWFLVLPMIFMLITPVWAMYHQLFTSPGWLVGESPDYLLGGIGLATIALEIWMLVEAFRLFPKAKGVLEADLAEGDVLVTAGD